MHGTHGTHTVVHRTHTACTRHAHYAHCSAYRTCTACALPVHYVGITVCTAYALSVHCHRCNACALPQVRGLYEAYLLPTRCEDQKLYEAAKADATLGDGPGPGLPGPRAGEIAGPRTDRRFVESAQLNYVHRRHSKYSHSSATPAERAVSVACRLGGLPSWWLAVLVA